MYEEKMERPRMSLERALGSMYGVLNIDDIASEVNKEGIAFLKVQVNTASGLLNAIAVMKESYLQHLFSEYLKRLPELTGSEMRRKTRFFFGMLADNAHMEHGMVVIPKKMREHAGIRENSGVYVVENSGYVIVSTSRAIDVFESLRFDAQPAAVP